MGPTGETSLTRNPPQSTVMARTLEEEGEMPLTQVLLVLQLPLLVHSNNRVPLRVHKLLQPHLLLLLLSRQ